MLDTSGVAKVQAGLKRVEVTVQQHRVCTHTYTHTQGKWSPEMKLRSVVRITCGDSVQMHGTHTHNQTDTQRMERLAYEAFTD